MKNIVSATLLLGVASLLSTPEAQAQSRKEKRAAAILTQAQPTKEKTPEEVAQEQQLRILEARAGNTSFGDGNGGAFRQLDKNSGGFTVRKFKSLRGQENKRGEGHQAPGIDPKGEPLTQRKHKKNFFSL
ncbi:MAG TPA: hypothetical protein VFO93_20105 [Hymenobacter sp.]|uniref:hypothetical protein n=1 Tax=Hymenobacter sp. TaxID=1898978 RepID=UPI002D7EA48B|nr:hypothetical protein [Hymenobacter sp.]HET9505861.1 hypothetical protein [Hymenobacter sp.]